MNIHKLARLAPFGRAVLVRWVGAGVPVAVVAREAGVSRQTVYKWCRRAAADAPAALEDRASTPHHSPQRLVRYRRLGAHGRSDPNNERCYGDDAVVCTEHRGAQPAHAVDVVTFRRRVVQHERTPGSGNGERLVCSTRPCRHARHIQ